MASKVAYICTECGFVFDTPRRRNQHHIENFYETVSVCPRCGSDEITLAAQCDICGEHFEKLEYDEEEGIYYCDTCRKEVKGE